MQKIKLNTVGTLIPKAEWTRARPQNPKLLRGAAVTQDMHLSDNKRIPRQGVGVFLNMNVPIFPMEVQDCSTGTYINERYSFPLDSSSQLKLPSQGLVGNDMLDIGPSALAGA